MANLAIMQMTTKVHKNTDATKIMIWVSRPECAMQSWLIHWTKQNQILTSSYCKMPKISVQMLQHVSTFKFTCSRGVYPAKQEALCHSVSHQLQHYLQQSAWSLTINPNRKHQTKCQIWDEKMETACSLKNKHNTRVFTSYNNAYNNRPQFFFRKVSLSATAVIHN